MKRRVYAAAIVLAVVAVAGSSDLKKGDALNNGVEERAETEKPNAISDRDIRGWALGCAAVVTERNHDSHILLGGCGLSSRDIKEKTEILSEGWGIDSREDLFETLERIDSSGHRTKFQMWGSYVWSLSEEEYQQVLASKTNDEQTQQYIRIARQYYEQLGDKGLYGWDYSRYIRLCRWAYVAGYISEQEAWEKIMPVARMLQKKFDSYADLGRNYLIGRQFWSGGESERNGWEYDDAFQRLREMRSSPWNRFDWDMDLSDTENMDGPNKLGGGLVARG
jgi:hypothetical protein